jgi:hypothetical protein
MWIDRELVARMNSFNILKKLNDGELPIPERFPFMKKPHYLLQLFEYKHLPDHLQKISKPFHDLAHQMHDMLPENPETTAMLRKLREAKDCAVTSNVITM